MWWATTKSVGAQDEATTASTAFALLLPLPLLPLRQRRPPVSFATKTDGTLVNAEAWNWRFAAPRQDTQFGC
jgi:hypothetical protein